MMEKRITKSVLQAYVTRVNKYRAERDMFPFSLDYATCYGGYCLEDEHGVYRLTVRMNARDMYHVLNGMLLTFEHMEKFAHVNP